MISLKFAPQANLRKVELVELLDYKAFFDFYISHYDKGIMFDVKEDGKTVEVMG
jgi:hypothetical protein